MVFSADCHVLIKLLRQKKAFDSFLLHSIVLCLLLAMYAMNHDDDDDGMELKSLSRNFRASPGHC